jgi:hypothetical protein
VGTHFGAVGFGRDSSALADQLRRLMSQADLVGTAEGDRLRVYRHVDPSGASVSVTIENDRVTCLTPGIAPGRVVAATISALLPDDCPYERPLEVEARLGDNEIPVAVTIDDLALSASVFEPGREVKLTVGALAEQISVFADEAAYRASGTPMAVESLIPSGLFAPDVLGGAGHRPSSRMLMSGIVSRSERREHRLLGHPFVVASIRSMGDDWAVAIDPDDLGAGGAPPVGAIVSGSFWLSGQALGEE